MVTNMRYVSLLILCVLMVVSSASAAPSLYYNGASDITRVGSGDLYFSSGEECVFAVIGTDVKVIYTDESAALKLTAGETINDICIGLDGLMYITTSSGLYREAVGDNTNPRSLGDLVHISEHGGRISAAEDGIVMLVGSPYYDITKFSYYTLSVIDYTSCPHSAKDVTADPDSEYFDFMVLYGSTGVSFHDGSFSNVWVNGSIDVPSGSYITNYLLYSIDMDLNGSFLYSDVDYYYEEGFEEPDLFWDEYYSACYFGVSSYTGSFDSTTAKDSEYIGMDDYVLTVDRDVTISYNYPVYYYTKNGDVYSDGVSGSRLGITYTDSVEFNASSYHRNDTARIDYEVEDLSAGTYTVVVRDPVNVIQLTETLSSPYGYYGYTFADNATFGNWSAKLCLDGTAVETDYAILLATGLSSVAWDKDSYDLGETGSISYEIGSYDSSTYDYSVDIYKAEILQTYLNCTSSSGVLEYTFSDITENTLYTAKLTKYVKGSSIPFTLVTDSCTVYVDIAPDACAIAFDQSVYGPNDLVNMSYSNCPNGSRILFRSDSSPWYDSKTYESISGNGSVLYQLSGAPAGIGYYAKVYSDSDIVIASDTMQIEGVVVGYCQVHGGIYDSQDYHPLIGTVFIGGSYSDVVGYGDYGAYSIIVPWGTYNISAVVSSYLTHNISNVAISGSSYDLNMFLSVNDTTTHVFRGSVTDADTNAAVDNVLIQVCNDTFDEYDFTSQSGVWVVNGLTSGANYTLYATKDDYHPYTYSFAYDPGDFYHNFMMSPVVVDEDVIEDDVIEDVLDDDETMTEYFEGKFREFAPTAWGIFLLSILLWLMAILTSFGGSSKRR